MFQNLYANLKSKEEAKEIFERITISTNKFEQLFKEDIFEFN